MRHIWMYDLTQDILSYAVCMSRSRSREVDAAPAIAAQYLPKSAGFSRCPFHCLQLSVVVMRPMQQVKFLLLLCVFLIYQSSSSVDSLMALKIQEGSRLPLRRRYATSRAQLPPYTP